MPELPPLDADQPELQNGWCSVRKIQTENTGGLIVKTPRQTIWCPHMEIVP